MRVGYGSGMGFFWLIQILISRKLLSLNEVVVVVFFFFIISFGCFLLLYETGRELIVSLPEWIVISYVSESDYSCCSG